MSRSSAAEDFDLDIPQLQAEESLKRLGYQTGYSVLFQVTDVEDIITNAVSGRFSIDEALRILFEGTYLSGGLTQSGVITISPKPKGTKTAQEENMAGTGNSGKVLSSFAAFVIGAVGPTASSAKVDELVVTTRKREESIVNVPVAVQAFTSANIEAAGLRELEDLSLFAPGLDFQNLGNSQGGRFNSGIRFRGMDVSITVPSNQTGSLFVDGIQTIAGASSIGFADIERVEVVKGPQAAYFGRGTFGGAINYVTRTPSDEFGGSIDAEYSPNFNSYNLTASVEGPIISDILTARLTGFSRRKGAMFKARDGGDLGEEQSDGIALTANLKPNDAINVKLRALYSQDDDGAFSSTFVPYTEFGNAPIGTPVSINTNLQQGLATSFARAYNLGAVPVIGVSSNTTFPIIQGLTGPIDTRDILLTPETFFGGPTAPGPNLNSYGLRANFQIYSEDASWDVTDAITLNLLAGYNDRATTAIRDGDQYDAFGWFNRTFLKIETFTVEGRATYNAGGRFRGLVGVNYYDESVDGDIDGGYTIFTNLFGFPGSTNTPGLDSRETQTLGVFGGIEFDVFEWLTAIFEGRWQDDEVTQITGNFGGPLTRADASYSEFLPRGILRFQPNEDTTFYASYSQGTLPGRFNTALLGLSAADRAIIDSLLPGLENITDSQKLESYELGWKQSLLDGSAFFSLVGYWMDWSNLTSNAGLSYIDSMGDAQIIFPIVPGAARLRGIEFEGNWAVTDKLDVAGTFGFSDAEYTDFVGRFVSGIFSGLAPGEFLDAEGNTLARSPKWTGSFSTGWTDQLSGDWDYSIRTDVIYNGRTFTDETNLAWIDSYALLNASVGAIRNDNLKVELFCRNCLDNDKWRTGRRFTDFGQLPLFFSAQGAVVQPLDSREIGLRVSFDF